MERELRRGATYVESLLTCIYSPVSSGFPTISYIAILCKFLSYMGDMQYIFMSPISLVLGPVLSFYIGPASYASTYTQT